MHVYLLKLILLLVGLDRILIGKVLVCHHVHVSVAFPKAFASTVTQSEYKYLIIVTLSEQHQRRLWNFNNYIVLTFSHSQLSVIYQLNDLLEKSQVTLYKYINCLVKEVF